ncbi:MAG: hypothetical protein Q7T03_00965, partial [Deltaproteobacteria bacterium]|nr:hypothetical protein [Deltaproteobacteria bacterium]
FFLPPLPAFVGVFFPLPDFVGVFFLKVRYSEAVDQDSFKKLFDSHKEKISEAWIKLSDEDLKEIHGDLGVFLKKISVLYKIPDKTILKELDAVQKNIKEGIRGDFALKLDPRE